MGTPGVPWAYAERKDDIVRVIKKYKGRLSYACKDLDCHHGTLKKYIDADPELTELVKAERHGFDNYMLDKAESYLEKAMDQETDLGSGLKASIYLLNNKGKERGYCHPEIAKEDHTKELVLAVETASAKVRAKCRIENDQLRALLDQHGIKPPTGEDAAGVDSQI